MNPSKLKQIAILLLVCINLTLAGNLLYARAIKTLVPKKTIADTMTFLERCGIWAEASSPGGNMPFTHCPRRAARKRRQPLHRR